MPLRAIISKQCYWVVGGKDHISLKIMRCFPESSYKVRQSWIKLVINSIWLPDVYVLFTKATYFKVSKNPNKKIAYTSPQSMSVCIVSQKNNLFLVDVKTNMSHKKSYFLHQILSFLPSSDDMSFFVKRLCAHVTCEDARVLFRTLSNQVFLFCWRRRRV
jgi:hypothetical protein